MALLLNSWMIRHNQRKHFNQASTESPANGPIFKLSPHSRAASIHLG